MMMSLALIAAFALPASLAAWQPEDGQSARDSDTESAARERGD